MLNEILTKMNEKQETTTQKITHFNKEAFENCNNLLSNLNNTVQDENQPLKFNLQYYNYFDLGAKIESLLTAIQIITKDESQNYNDKNSVIYDLTDIIKQVLPNNEMEFLDNLFLNQSINKNNIIEIKKII
ncbi:hypothetical protein [Flavobacterium psychrophilum]|uniref:Uncharacterized protein n=1 Tax=Flavobacterium psychrophilum TaxID=96345 RepID=A0A7U2NFS3_FLAPS|nr:hypothetical protein [Flavobacterium psychrophilum]OAE92117.1 hypothetical protein SU65_10195 [Flavobacterium psychrophilum]QRE04185.1 hypothetical protein H0H26_00840 [Flavobacterium psychrophilum]